MNALETAVRKLKRGLGLSSNSRLVARMRPAYDSLLSICYGKRGLVRVLNGQERVLVRAAHRYATEDYEPPVFDYLKRHVQPGAIVLDVGAHVGLFTVLLSRWAGPTGHVYAFEPTPVTRAALVDHLALNNVAGQATVCPFAVGDEEGTSVLYAVANSPENTLSSKHGRLPQAQGTPVTVTTIDAFCAARSLAPTLIKIDIEGFEIHALRGAKQILARHRPTLVVEMHPMNWPEIGVAREQAEQIFADLSYRLTPLEGQADPLAEYGHVVLEPMR
jgi:FkbM family methyltransferase